MLVALLSGWAQSTNNATQTNPPYRTIFNIATLVLTVQMTGVAFGFAGGQVGVFDAALFAPLLVAVLSYYLVNSITVATVVGLWNVPLPLPSKTDSAFAV